MKSEATLCKSVKTSFTRRCDMGVDAALASRYQLRGENLIVCGSVVWPWGSSPPLVSPWLEGIRQALPMTCEHPAPW